jgi:hypothetical protein
VFAEVKIWNGNILNIEMILKHVSLDPEKP